MGEITIKKATHEITAWARDIKFEYEGKDYLVTLYWDSYDGYDITFKNKDNGTPVWADKWINDVEYSESLLVKLDALTEGKCNE